MSKHTPGPWTAEADPYEDGTPYFKFKAGSGFVDEDGGGFSFTAIISEADAKLIVASPKMIDLLIRFYKHGYNTFAEHDELIALIEEATGRNVRAEDDPQ